MILQDVVFQPPKFQMSLHDVVFQPQEFQMSLQDVVFQPPEFQMSLQDVVFQPPELVFPPHSLKIVVEVKVSGPPHVVKLWVGIGNGMLSVKYFHFIKASFCVC